MSAVMISTPSIVQMASNIGFFLTTQTFLNASIAVLICFIFHLYNNIVKLSKENE